MFSTYYIDNAHVLSFINSYCFSLLNIIVLARKCVKGIGVGKLMVASPLTVLAGLFCRYLHHTLKMDMSCCRHRRHIDSYSCVWNVMTL